MNEGDRPGSIAKRLAASTRLLVVEDEDDIAAFLRAYFRASGYDLVHVNPTSAQAVVEAVEEQAPDCVLLDYGLRGFSGHDAYELLRNDERFAFLPIIVITADATARHRAAMLESGIDGFFTKPFSVNTLADFVAERITVARSIAEVGRDEEYGLFTNRYLSARISDELRLAREGHPLAFALVKVRKMEVEHRPVDGDATAVVVRRLIQIARERLPAHCLLGRTDTDELAVLVPRMRAAELERVLDIALDELRGNVTLPGGAAVRVEANAGVAGYPEHAHDPDELYMCADAALADADDAGVRVRIAL